MREYEFPGPRTSTLLTVLGLSFGAVTCALLFFPAWKNDNLQNKNIRFHNIDDREKTTENQNSRRHGKSRDHKRRVCLFVGWNGSKYQGSHLCCKNGEYDVDVPSVSLAILRGLYSFGGIRPERYNKPVQKIFWKPASRTDKGVHAIGCAISLALQLNDADFEKKGGNNYISDKALKEINSYLPDDVVIFSGQKIHPVFDAQKHCAVRIYEYVIRLKDLPANFDFSLFEESLRMFQGVHNFHNFGKYSSDPLKTKDSNTLWNRVSIEEAKVTPKLKVAPLSRLTNSDCYRRVIYSCSVKKEGDKMIVLLRGKSFLYNQVRRMVGSALLVGSGEIPIVIVHAALKSPFELPVKPLAPACGLLLSESIPYRHKKYRFEVDVEIKRMTRQRMTDFKLNKVYPQIEKDFASPENSLSKWFDYYKKQCMDYANWDEFKAGYDEWSRRVKERLSVHSTSQDAKSPEVATRVSKGDLPSGWFTCMCIELGELPLRRMHELQDEMKKAIKQGKIMSGQDIDYYLDAGKSLLKTM